MKNSVYLGITCLLIGLILLMMKFNFDFEELENEFAAERVIKDKKVEELEKEIRILKTDVNIIYYGFENEEEK